MAIFFLFAQKGPTICCRLPDEASFLEIGGGCITPSYPPGSFGPDYCTNSFNENCKFQITIFRLLHLPLHFVHVVSTYAALIKTPKGRKGNIHPTLNFVSIALSRVFPFVFKLVFYLFSNLPDCNTLKNLHLI